MFGEKYHTLLGEIPPLPNQVKTNYYNIAYAAFVAEHMKDGIELFEFVHALKTVVKPNGIIALIMPDARSMGIEFWNQDYTHRYPTTERNVRMICEENNLKVENITFIEVLFKKNDVLDCKVFSIFIIIVGVDDFLDIKLYFYSIYQYIKIDIMLFVCRKNNLIMNQPLVSICIPCYNAADFIAETIQSVLNQTYQNFEIIICNDRSTDNTLDVIKKFEDKRIQVHENEKNLGCSGNYNRVLSYAKGKYTKLLCADDIIIPTCIEKQVAAFEQHADKNIALVTAHKFVINEKGKKLFVKRFPGKGFISGKKAIRKSVLHGTNIFGEPGLPLMKTSILNQTSGVIEDKYYTYCNDFDLWCKMLLFGDLYVINEPMFSFRIVSVR